jgi:hypothetical protein
MAVSKARGGLNMGLGPTTLAWSVLILAFVVYLGVTRTDVEGAQGPAHAR